MEHLSRADSRSNQSSASQSIDSVSSVSLLKQHGLDRPNYLKKIRTDLIQLTNYIYSTSPSFTSVHKFMSAIRIIQLLLPCLIPANLKFWKSGSVDQVAANVISIPFLIIPPITVFQAAHIFLIIYNIIQYLVIIIIFSSSYYFKRNAKLPKPIPPLISFYQATFGHYFQPIVFYTIFEGISFLIINKSLTVISIPRFIVLCTFSFIGIIFNFLFMLIITSQTLVFRPNSLASTTSPPQFFILFTTTFINIVFGISTNLNKICQIFCFILNIIFYIISGMSVFTFGGYIEDIISNFVLSSSITGAAFTILDLIFIILEKKGSLAVLFCFIIFFIIVVIFNSFIIRKINLNNLQILDIIEENKEEFSNKVKSPNHFIQIGSIGIKNAHPIIINLSFFILGIEKWKRNAFVYFIYSKFIAIYPEETSTLKYLCQLVTNERLHGPSIRCIKEQTTVIMKQRELNLSHELRNKLSILKKQNLSTKHKLRRLWDVVISENSIEIEIATKMALSAMNETNADFKHLIHEFPNNQNVSHIYAIFLKEIMANEQLSHEMHLKTKNLLIKNTIIVDQTHEFGLMMYPNLPNSIKEVQVQYPILDQNKQFNNGPNELDKELQNDFMQLASVRDTIENLRIPSIFGTKMIRIFTTLFFFVIPCIIGLILVNFYVNELKEPLQFISSLSILRTYAYQAIGFSLRYVGECLSIFENKKDYEGPKPITFGGTWDTKEQFSHLISKTTEALQDFNSFQKFEEKNYNINQAHDLIFQNTVPYTFYTSGTNFTTSNISIQSAIFDYVIQQEIILSGKGIDQDVLNSGIILNPINNAFPITQNIHLAMQYMIDFISETYERAKRLGKILMISFIVIEVVVYITTLVIEIKWINSNKLETYQCLFSIPKNVVSELAENYDLKNVDFVEEMNKQDENILKIFNSSGYSEFSVSHIFMLILGTFFIIIFSISCILIFVSVVNQLAETVINSAPHLHYLLASYSMLRSCVNWLIMILFESKGYPIPTIDFNFARFRMNFTLKRSLYFYHLVCCGGTGKNEIPFRGFIDGVNKASEHTYNECSMNKNKTFSSYLLNNENDISNLLLHENQSDFDTLLYCSPVDITFILIQPVIEFSIIPYELGIMKSIESLNPIYENIWHAMISPLYEFFFEPLHQEIIPSIDEDLKKWKQKAVTVISILLILIILIEVIIYIEVILIENYIRSVLRLLLHCNPSVIFASQKITRILAGDFSDFQNDTKQNKDFFDTIFVNLPDAIMYANTDMIIQSANKACQRTFGDIEIVGKNIQDFFNSNKFSGDVETLFESVNTNPIKEITYETESNSKTILQVTSMMACGKFVIICRNVTQSHNYNTLILEEKQNSDKLLSTILPPSLVSRVQQGEKNISFAVQSASILFSDIVSFTPWCGSLPAEKVMSTLNILFKRMDSILDTKPTMTKIKCIGDCYMAAGGIFAEINQPAQHAKEVVSFGLQSIKEIELINKEIDQNLRIRVGVNSGGPIVAGVLGIGKPTFEIIGPPINRAQQMEQNGMPMMVHISVSVYQLICSFNFKFRNRRMIKCKNETIETYLVEP